MRSLKGLVLSVIMLQLFIVCLIMAGCESTKPNVVQNPILTPQTGNYTQDQTVSISCPTEGAEIRYTLDGSDPPTNSEIYASPIIVTRGTTLKAMASKPGMVSSDIVSAFYSGVTPTPSIIPSSGSYYSGHFFVISINSYGFNQEFLSVRYTMDGTDPNNLSPAYQDSFALTESCVIKVRAFYKNWNPSPLISLQYNITAVVVSTPIITPQSGNVTFGTLLNISCSTPGAVIHYTLNGYEPTENSQQYSSPFYIEQAGPYAIKAKAFKEFYLPSATAIATYTVEIPSPTMVYVQGGTFNNGTSNVTLSSYYISKYEVTQLDYQAIMGVNPSYFSGLYRPVERVSWFSAIEYCNRLSIQEGLTPCYSYGTYGSNPDLWPNGWNSDDLNHTNVTCNWTLDSYRLPSEAEWEFAAQGGNQTHNYSYSGSNNINAVAWYHENSNVGDTGYSTHIVGTKASNELGLFDMSGNVFEWCWDMFEGYPSGNQNNPHGGTDSWVRVFRGGCWWFEANYCQVYWRGYGGATYDLEMVGFRVCRNASRH